MVHLLVHKALMRFPHYLYRTASQIWHFRQRIPSDLQVLMGRAVIKRTLRTRDVLTAQRRALELAQQYAQVFAVARRQGVAKDSIPAVDDIVKSAKKAKPYKIIRSPDGTVQIEANGDKDHGHAMEAWDRVQVESIGPVWRESFVQQLPANIESSNSKVSTPSSALRGGGVPPLAIGRAAVQWLANIKPDTLPKTFSIKSAAVNGFVAFYGDKKPLGEVSRVDVGRWVEAMKKSGLSTPTLVNKTSYLRGFFDWSKARGLYVSDGNPAQGQVIFRMRERRARRVLGFKAFPADQIRILFHRDAFHNLSPSGRWGALIGLYTGMRVAEVGQLALSDFVEVGGIPRFRITNEGLGQSVKTDASLRTVPIHPHLIELGILDRVKMLRKHGEKRFFPKVKFNVVNGAGNWLSTTFTRHIGASLVLPEKGKYGFHSLRKTFVQELQTLGVPSEIRAAYVGHELDDEHHATYSRAPTSRELFDAVSKLDWKLDLKTLAELLH
ncbi:integrase [Rhodanobacter glycinis]|uniref:Integrase n=2 Tax=Rhodanobacter glycinis TaxID=582702 RepID=A0A502BXW7_9GAMM|nr:integrase [Rhodanobacter glycinis]